MGADETGLKLTAGAPKDWFCMPRSDPPAFEKAGFKLLRSGLRVWGSDWAPAMRLTTDKAITPVWRQDLQQLLLGRYGEAQEMRSPPRHRILKLMLATNLFNKTARTDFRTAPKGCQRPVHSRPRSCAVTMAEVKLWPNSPPRGPCLPQRSASPRIRTLSLGASGAQLAWTPDRCALAQQLW